MQETKKGSRAATATKSKKAAVKDPADYAAEELEEYLKQLFRVADTNGDGVLQPHEMTRLLKMSGFGFTDEVIAQVIALTDANHDGVIQYEEFVPAMIAVMLCVDEMEEAAAPKSKPAVKDPADYAAEELEEYLKQLFRVADTNGDGVLQPHEMTRLLKMSGFGFTDEVIAQVIALTDANHDGVIQYEEFVPAMIAVMLCVDEMEEAGAAPAAPPTRSTGGTLPGGWPARSTPRDLWAANDPRLRYGLSHLEDFHNEAQHSSMRSRLTSKCRPTRYAGVTCLK